MDDFNTGIGQSASQNTGVSHIDEQAPVGPSSAAAYSKT